MGLFNRKGSKVSADGGSTASNSTLNSSAALRSPLNSKSPNTSFTSPSLPDVTLPRPPDPNLDPAAYLRSIYAVRERSKVVFEKAKRGQLEHFDVDMKKFEDTATYVVSIIKASTWRNFHC